MIQKRKEEKMSDNNKKIFDVLLEFNDEETQRKDNAEIAKQLEKEQNKILNRYEFGEIDYDTYVELSSARSDEYKEYINDLALSYDDELNEKMAFIINANLETF